MDVENSSIDVCVCVTVTRQVQIDFFKQSRIYYKNGCGQKCRYSLFAWWILIEEEKNILNLHSRFIYWEYDEKRPKKKVKKYSNFPFYIFSRFILNISWSLRRVFSLALYVLTNYFFFHSHFTFSFCLTFLCIIPFANFLFFLFSDRIIYSVCGWFEKKNIIKLIVEKKMFFFCKRRLIIFEFT